MKREPFKFITTDSQPEPTISTINEFQKGTSLINYLPNYYNKTAGTWKDLGVAFDATTYLWEEASAQFRNGFIFALANEEQLSYLEEIFFIPDGSALTLEQRRGRLLAKYLPKATTLQKVLEIAMTFYPNEVPYISEVEADYTLTIFFTQMKIIPSDIDIFREAIESILQADLDFFVRLDANLSAFEHETLHTITNGNLTVYKHG